VIAADRSEIRTPADLAGKTVGVTGVPSDDAVLDTILRSGGVDPSAVRRINIGFNAVAALSAGKVDAATAFWNAEGVQLQQLDVPIREFRVDEFGAPRYPELVIAAMGGSERARLGTHLVDALTSGYGLLANDPGRALDDLTEDVPGIDREAQSAQLQALIAASAFDGGEMVPTPDLDPMSVAEWRAWATKAGLLTGS
jgi:ABC-type nitrate/sulfonate/bicarbonate transport system substrate-binding protein